MQSVSAGKINTFHLDKQAREGILHRAQQFLARQDEILFAYAHGSFLEGTFFRDLDLAVFVKPESIQQTTYRYETQLEDALEKFLKINFPLDLRVLNKTSISFQYQVICGRLLFERHPEARIDYVTGVISRYLDIKPMLTHHMQEAFNLL